MHSYPHDTTLIQTNVMSIRTCILQLCILGNAMQICENFFFLSVKISLVDSKKGTPNPPRHPSPLQPKAPPVISKVGRGKMTSQSESRLRGHPTLRRAQDNWGKKKRRGEEGGWLAWHITEHQVELRADVCPETTPPRLPAGSQEKKEGDHGQW